MADQAVACWTRALYALVHNRASALAHRQQQEKTMLIVELNVAGYRLSGEWAGLRRSTLRPARFNARSIHWRMPQLRHTPAA